MKLIINTLAALLFANTMFVMAQKGGNTIEIEFTNGDSHNHPTFAIWLETLEGEYIQPLFVTRSLATGTYMRADAGNGRWSQEAGEARRPATLPYFLHKRNIKAPDGYYLPTPQKPIADAYTGATPIISDKILLKTDKNLTGRYKLLVEVNQPWDFNQFWHNNLYLKNIDYLTSGQPSLVYMVEIDFDNQEESFTLNPIGHGNPVGENGKLYTDISGFTTARNIFSKIVAKIK